MAKNNKKNGAESNQAQQNTFENNCGCNHHAPDDRKNRKNCKNAKQENCNCRKQKQELQ